MINTILLDKYNHYIDSEGDPPRRPSFDKQLLTAFCYNQFVSKKGFDLLPKSIQKFVTVDDNNITRGITIKEISNLSTVLLIIRSKKTIKRGKKFRLNCFNNLIKEKNIELWVRNNKG